MDIELEYIKLVHVSCAVLTGLSFFGRGILLMQDSSWLKWRGIKIIPHLIDTLLLLTALLLLLKLQLSPLQQPWLLAKIIALLLYILLGLAAFRFAKGAMSRLLCWLLALGVLFHIYFFAISKSVGFYRYFI